MGRRKIEIQPITHERNRSVTFLKRKNGLFKKAYELGVLCSVDVAVIIFEERPGHHVKLFQYCSTDVNSMVQRHLRVRPSLSPTDHLTPSRILRLVRWRTRHPRPSGL
ncbi:SRF-like protein [Daedalea quercina L-15889]|uniref:SRF-like protein n=1 Tax=Daedalea quercina L-15889 TaxID=1314783 RepID=A0A165LGN1_9APHY|nr:SRF-like protein [Daedalea quercina L-15889]